MTLDHHPCASTDFVDHHAVFRDQQDPLSGTGDRQSVSPVSRGQT